MELRIKELLREQGLRMADLADRMKMDPSNLKKSLGNNPKLSTLQDVAKALNVQIHELFTPNLPTRPKGVVFVDGHSYALVEMPCVVQIPTYSNYAGLRKDIERYVKGTVTDERTNAFCAVVDGFELVSLVYDCGSQKFILTLYYSDAMSKTFFYDLMEYAEWKDEKGKDPVLNLDDVCGQIINDIETVVPYEYKEYTTPADRESMSLEQEGEF